MRFVVSSTELLKHLNAISRVISSKNTLPILDNFLLKLEGTTLMITASDLETTLITQLELENSEEDGLIAVQAKIMLETLKEFPEQPLTFVINPDSLVVEILSANGKYSIVGHNGEDFPSLPHLSDNKHSINLPHDMLLTGINKTLFATADDELRPVMNGIYLEFSLSLIHI